MKTQLLCTFTTRAGLADTLRHIKLSYTVSAGTVYILENKELADTIYCTYNVELENTPVVIPASTIGVHRKKQTNTLYTINALNQLIMDLNGGKLDRQFAIQWDNYRDTILVTAYGKLKIISTKLTDTINLESII